MIILLQDSRFEKQLGLPCARAIANVRLFRRPLSVLFGSRGLRVSRRHVIKLLRIP